MRQTIIHVDMDAFFASVEVRDNPDLKGKPVIIGAQPHMRGVVSAASYEARKYGVHSAMNIKTAYRLCPHGIYITPRIDYYAKVSRSLREIWCSYSEKVEFLALDEAYIDISSNSMTPHKGVAIARKIQKEIYEKEQLTASVGVGYSMASAKLASEEKKPNGLFMIPDKETWQNLVHTRPVSIIHGVGRITRERLHKFGIDTVADFVSNATLVLNQLGKNGKKLLAIANGDDFRIVTPYFENSAKSIGQERTFQEDSNDPTFLKSLLRLYARELAKKLESDGLFGTTITVKATYSNMQSASRSKTVEATNEADTIYELATKLFETLDSGPMRLIGLSISNLQTHKFEQLSFADLNPVRKAKSKKEKSIHKTMKELEQRFGKSLLQTGSEFEAEQIIHKRKRSQKTIPDKNSL